MQGFWKGVLPSIVMVSNPSVNYMLYEYLRARLEDWRRALSAGDGQLRRTSPAGEEMSARAHCPEAALSTQSSQAQASRPCIRWTP